MRHMGRHCYHVPDSFASFDRLYDGEQLREGWSVLVRGECVAEVGSSIAAA